MEEYREIRQLSLVAFYGEKDQKNKFWQTIEKIQNVFEKHLGTNYQRYSTKQLHGTIVGLEAARFESALINKNFLEHQHKMVKMDLEAVLNYACNSDLLPVDIKVGGYNNEDHVFTSRSLSPFQRSFTIQNDTVVAMGWPFNTNTYSPVLDTMRRRLSRYGALHKYHSAPDSFDNDFFFVLGNLEEKPDRKDSDTLCKLIREEMQTWKDTKIVLAKDNIGVVAYRDTKLMDVKYYSLNEAIQLIKELEDYYPDYGSAVENKNWLVS